MFGFNVGGGVPTVLQEVQVPVIENRVCQEMFQTAGHSKVILSSFLCAGYANGQRDSCEVLFQLICNNCNQQSTNNYAYLISCEKSGSIVGRILCLSNIFLKNYSISFEQLFSFNYEKFKIPT